MIDVTILFSRVFLLVLMMLPGVLLKKFKLVGPDFGVSLSNFVLYASTPAMIIIAFYQDFNRAVLIRSLIVVGFCLIFHLVFFGVAFLVYRKRGDDEASLVRTRLFRFASMFTNVGYMGIPLIQGLFAGQEIVQEAVIYASFYVVCFNIIVWTFGCFTFTGDRSYMSLKKAFLNPAAISIVIGMIIYLSPLNRYLPSVCEDALGMLNATVAPLSMAVIGLRLLDIDWKNVWRDLALYRFLFLRMLLIPALCFCILKLSQWFGYYDDLVFKVLFICASTPCATVTVMFSEKFGGDAPYAGKMVCTSTLISVGTMPLVALLLYLF